ncbi:MAG TPA: hypothetical protein VGG49_00665 [Steroidobacteraceae bacterium]|jgi:hypothetical protein
MERMMRNRPGIIAAVTALSLLITCAAYADAPVARLDQHRNQALVALMQRTDADSLAAAGLLSVFGRNDQPLLWMQRSVAAAPQRADLVWLELQICLKSPHCNPDPIEQHLRALDPSNGAGWLVTLDRAYLGRNQATMDTAMNAIAHSDHVDIYWTALIAHLTEATTRTGKMPLSEAEVEIIGILAAQVVPAYQIIGKSCSAERLLRSGVSSTCRGVAAALQRGDTLITEGVGNSLALSVWPEQSAPWRAASEAQRSSQYRMSLEAKLDAEPWSEGRAKRFLILCKRQRRERDVLVARIVDAGEQPNPPEL